VMKICTHYICREQGAAVGAVALSASGQSLPEGGQ
jgi:hypothetical protein